MCMTRTTECKRDYIIELVFLCYFFNLLFPVIFERELVESISKTRRLAFLHDKLPITTFVYQTLLKRIS